MTANDAKVAMQLVKCSFLADALLASGEQVDNELLDACLTTSASLWRGVLSASDTGIVQRAITAWLHRPFGDSTQNGPAPASISAHELQRIDGLALPDDAQVRALCDATWRLLDRRGQLSTADLIDLAKQRLTPSRIGEISALISKRLLVHAIYRTAA